MRKIIEGPADWPRRHDPQHERVEQGARLGHQPVGRQLAAQDANQPLNAVARGVTLTVLPVEDGVAIEVDREILDAVMGNIIAVHDHLRLGATHLPDEQEIAGDQDPPRRFINHQVVRAVPRHVEELQP